MNQEKPPEKPSKIEEAAKLGAREAVQRTLKKYLSKETLEKVGAWLTTKLGLKALGSAIGSSVGPLGTAAGAAIGEIVERVAKKVGKLLSPLLTRIKKDLRKPEVAIVLAGSGAVSIFVIGAPVGLIIGVPLVLLGGLSFVAGGALTVAGTTLGTFLGIIFATPVGSITFFITALVVGTIVGLMALTLFIVITTAGAFIVPSVPPKEVSPYFEVEKTVSRNKIPNDDLVNKPCVTYRVKIPPGQPIEIITIVDERTVVCNPNNTNNPRVVTPIDVPPPSGQITNWNSQPYELCFDDTFFDCRVCNTVTVTADIVGGETGERASDTQCIAIGTPPEDCPSGWPTPKGYITQGPNTPREGDGECTSHYGQEAIDIGNVGIGTDVLATHRGTTRWGNSQNGGLYVAIEGICNGKSFTSYYYHLSSVNFGAMGTEVTPGTKIGETGNTGIYSEGAHLHYEFIGLEMDYRYIPISDDVLENCCTICGSCHDILCPNISW